MIGDLRNTELMRGLFTGKVQYAFAVNNAFPGLPDAVITLCRAAFGTVFTAQLRACQFHVVQQSSDHEQSHVRGQGFQPPNPYYCTSAPWANTERPISTSRRVGSRSSTRGARTASFSASSQLHLSHLQNHGHRRLLWFRDRTQGLRATDPIAGAGVRHRDGQIEIDPRLRPFFNYVKFSAQS